MLTERLLLNCNWSQRQMRIAPAFLNSENSVNSVKKSPAFTLLELLVAMAVLSIILVVLMNIVQSATALWRNSENRMETYRETRAALQVIASDLRNALASTNTSFFTTNLPTNTPNIGFLAALPLSAQDANSLGDVCTVGYFRAYDNKSPVAGSTGRQSYNLYRYFVTSNQTFTNLINNPATALSASLNSTNCEILSRNVIGFNVNCFVANGGNLTAWSQNATTPMPNLVEITLTVINNERTMRFPERNAAGEWDNFSGNTTSTDYLQNTKTFTKRIKLNTQ